MSVHCIYAWVLFFVNGFLLNRSKTAFCLNNKGLSTAAARTAQIVDHCNQRQEHGYDNAADHDG